MRHLLLIPIILLALISSCSIGDIAGSKGGSETTNGIYACVLNPDGSPAAGSVVRMRRADYVSQPLLAKQAITSKEILTDSLGRFLITGIDRGEYCVEVNDTAALSGAALFKFTIFTNDDTLDLGTDSLRPYAVLNGLVDTAGTGGRQLFVQVKGLERFVEVDSDGSFTINDLPGGYLDVVISDGAAAGPAKELINVKTSPDDTVNVNVSGSALFSEFIYLNTSSPDLAGSSISGFPVIIRLDSQSFDFTETDPQGTDIHFVKIDGTPLPFEIEQWDPTAGKAAVWVRVDTLRGSSTEQCIVMKWGGSDLVYQSNGAAVFDTAGGFAGVWHLNEDPSAGTGAIKDRTASGFNGTASGSMTSDNVVSGMVGDGLTFNGVSDTISVGVLKLNGNYTLSCWVKADQGLWVNWRLIIKEASYTLWYDNLYGGFRSEHFTDTFIWRGIYQDCSDSVPYPISLDTWYYLASTYDGDRIRLYVNGEIVDSTLSIGVNPHANEDKSLLFGGRMFNDTISEFFKGTMDEVRVEKEARSAEWIKLCYLNQRPDGVLVRFKRQ